MARTTKSVISLLIANLLTPIAILIFASGFFPYKAFLPGLAEYETSQSGIPPKAIFDKVVFMVVDALRSDFVFSEDSAFSFTQSLISSGAAIPFTAHATSPTITMPRIKAITTGSIPSFLDVILNFAESDTTSTLATQDTWLAQMKAKKTGKLVMYGDDTWIKLFPESFDRSDGTSSFFVADFTEVDNNVTRHVPDELENDDWNTMVLHYLGLDHIGHKAGPRSPNMVPKQREMDGIVRLVYQAIESQQHLGSTLLVLCGDHGMNDAGNHGGSSSGETSPALVFMSPKLKDISSGKKSPLPVQEEFQYYTTVEQSDIAPTLGALLGFPIPRNNLGAFITDFLAFWPSRDDKLRILLQNAKQILNIVTATFSPALFDQESLLGCSDPGSDIEKLGCSWKSILSRLDGYPSNMEGLDEEKLLTDLSVWSRNAQDIMSSTASNYDMTKLITGSALAVLAAIFAAVSGLSSFGRSFLRAFPLLATTLSYGIMMFASSYVEEEHHFWYWTVSGWILLVYFKRNTKFNTALFYTGFNILILLTTVRIVRRWNQTGQKFAGEPDIAHTFLPLHKDLLWDLIGATYLWNFISLVGNGLKTWRSSTITRTVFILVSSSVLGCAAFVFKLAFTNEDAPELLNALARAVVASTAGPTLVSRARFVFLGIGIKILYAVAQRFFSRNQDSQVRNTSRRAIHDLIVLFLMTQSRASNIPLLLLFEIQFYLLSQLRLSLIEISTTALLLQYTSFFAFGGTNAISSIDLSSAYNGVSGYNVLAVGILTLVSNWAGPIYWTSATSIMLANLSRNGQKNVLINHLILLTIFTVWSLCFVMAACTVLRAHLFIWTVFSPKYLYTMAWTFGQHILINAGFGSLLFAFGAR